MWTMLLGPQHPSPPRPPSFGSTDRPVRKRVGGGRSMTKRDRVSPMRTVGLVDPPPVLAQRGADDRAGIDAWPFACAAAMASRIISTDRAGGVFRSGRNF